MEVPSMKDFVNAGILENPEVEVNGWTFMDARFDCSKDKDTWNEEAAITVCHVEFAMAGLRHAGTDSQDPNHPLSQLHNQTVKQISNAFASMESKKYNGNADSAFFRKVKLAAAKAVKAYDDGKFNDNSRQLDLTQELPAHSCVLACRFVDANGSMDGILASYLATLNRADLMQITSVSDGSAPASALSGTSIDISDTVAAGLIAKQKEFGAKIKAINEFRDKASNDLEGLRAEVDSYKNAIKDSQAAITDEAVAAAVEEVIVANRAVIEEMICKEVAAMAPAPTPALSERI